MDKFKKGGFSKGPRNFSDFKKRDDKKGGFGNRGGGDRGDRGPVTMHRAVCAQCGKTCEVPFRPTGDKPVFCSDCFGGSSNDRGNSRERTSSFGRDNDRSFSDRKSFDRDERPKTYSNESRNSAPSITVEDIEKSVQKQFDVLHKKLDRLMEQMNVKENFQDAVEKVESVSKKVVKEVKKDINTVAKKVVKATKEKKAPVKKVVKAVAKKVAPKKAVKKTTKK